MTTAADTQTTALTTPTANPTKPTIERVAQWYSAGEVCAAEAIRWQQKLCKHKQFATGADRQTHCLDCGKHLIKLTRSME